MKKRGKKRGVKEWMGWMNRKEEKWKGYRGNEVEKMGVVDEK